MDDADIIWTQSTPLAEQTLFRDWDYLLSMIASLRLYLFEHGTIPLWNYTLCAGKPELANPNSWAFTWPSLFAYLFPPVWASLSLWAVMCLVGLASLYTWLRRADVGRAGATAGAALFVFNGYFASHFNQGHQTFAFCYLLPVLFLVFDKAYAAVSAGIAARRWLLAMALSTFAFFSAALPHPIFHFYPAFVIYVVFRAISAAKHQGSGDVWRTNLTVGIAHAFGIALALYKLWPVASWQMQFPRKGLAPEITPLLDVWLNTLRFTPDYFARLQVFPDQVWSFWEYNAFVGPVPWIAAIFVLVMLAKNRLKSRLRSPHQKVTALALTCVALGMAFALGNQHPFGPGRFFQHLPIASGIRVFARYQVLTVFGLALLTAVTLDVVQGWLASHTKSMLTRRAIVLCLAASVIAPAAGQAALLVRNILGISNSRLAAAYGGLPRPEMPRLIVQHHALVKAGWTTQTLLLERGYWVSTCYEPLSIRSPTPDVLTPGATEGLLKPDPDALLKLGSTDLELAVGAVPSAEYRLNFALLPQSSSNVPLRIDERQRILARSPSDGKARFSAAVPAAKEGALATGCAFFCMLVWLATYGKQRQFVQRMIDFLRT